MNSLKKIFLTILFAFSLLKVCADTPIPKINFQQNSVEINLTTNDGYWKDKTIEDIIAFFTKTLVDNPNIVIQITGYCDSSEKKVKKLSLQRARYIKELIVKHNIPNDRIKIVGKGIDKSILTNETETESIIRHRRVLIAIIDFDYKNNKADKKAH